MKATAKREWTRAQVIDAIHEYAEQHGRPPTSAAWRNDQDPSHPSTKYVTEQYGWANMIEAAGFPRPRRENKNRPSGDTKPFPLSGRDATQYGAVVTFENSAGQRLVLHSSGQPGRLVPILHAQAAQLDPSFLVLCVSTPTSIYTDLKGDRSVTRNGFGPRPRLPEIATVPSEILHPSVKAVSG